MSVTIAWVIAIGVFAPCCPGTAGDQRLWASS
jgi:hypothetical protein